MMSSMLGFRIHPVTACNYIGALVLQLSEILTSCSSGQTASFYLFPEKIIVVRVFFTLQELWNCIGGKEAPTSLKMRKR